MFLDLQTLSAAQTIQCDLCIVGGGPAGISMAREFVGTNLKVCLVESAQEYNEPSQNLYIGAQQTKDKRSRSLADGIFYGPGSNKTRLRFFGGTSNHWGGYCTPLTPHDLTKRDWMPHSGWPLSWEELSRYYPRAQDICEAGPYIYDQRLWQGLGLKKYDFDPKKIINRFYQYSPPTRFGDRYGADLKNASNLSVLFNANVTNIALTSNSRLTDHLKVTSLSGKTGTVKARHYVLACGGIENARLLLASNDVAGNGVGNAKDLVGRFFMDHLYDSVGSLLVSERPEQFLKLYSQIVPNVAGHPLAGANPKMFQAAMCASEEAQKKNAAAGAAIFVRGDWRKADEGIQVVYQAIESEGGSLTGKFGGHLLDILLNLDTSIPEIKNVMQGKRPKHLPILFAIAEQTPNKLSRITLGPERDALNMPRPRIDWRLTELDKRTFAQMPELLGAEFGRLGIGRARKAPWLDDDAIYFYRSDFSRILDPGRHHAGTTRMASDPTSGVVDPDCRVFGVGNLSIAGSSVFPTIGYANPTLTIVALALRLADHLKTRLV
jgi:choline dehydrogenase-like flavoprotein